MEWIIVLFVGWWLLDTISQNSPEKKIEDRNKETRERIENEIIEACVNYASEKNIFTDFNEYSKIDEHKKIYEYLSKEDEKISWRTKATKAISRDYALLPWRESVLFHFISIEREYLFQTPPKYHITEQEKRSFFNKIEQFKIKKLTENRMERERLEESNRLEKAKREQERLEKERLGTLTEQDKLQEKLDNYLYYLSNDNIATGRAYERYIGYLYEKNHWQVTFNGCIKGNEDNGIDLICQKGNEVHLIQAKNWNKKIFNKVVHQLYGSKEDYRLNTNNPQLNIIGIIFTANGADSNAMQVAQKLNIQIKTEQLNKNYPLVKYKKQTNHYYLPPEIDPLNELNYQYDQLNIDFSVGDTYCKTILEAKKLKLEEKNKSTQTLVSVGTIYERPKMQANTLFLSSKDIALWSEIFPELKNNLQYQLHILQCLALRFRENLTTLPESIGQLQNLKELTLESCINLSTLPESIGQLKNLTTLRLRNCKNLTTLPESIGQLSNLKKLDLDGYYNLTTLPESIGQLQNLQELSLSSCKNLTTLSESIGQLQNLQKLHLSGCENLQRLPESIGQLQNLQYLDLSGCENLTTLPESIGQLKNLTTLYLDGCKNLQNLSENIEKLPNCHIWGFKRLRKSKNTQKH